MRPEAARSNPACRPEAADDNAAAQAGPVPVSDTVETQAAKQLWGPAVSHATSLQEVVDPSPTGQPLVVNDRSIQLADGLLSSANPHAVRSACSPTADETHVTVRNCKWRYGATLLLLLSNFGHAVQCILMHPCILGLYAPCNMQGIWWHKQSWPGRE